MQVLSLSLAPNGGKCQMTHEEIGELQHKAGRSRSPMRRAWEDQDPATRVAIWIAGAVALAVVFAICWAAV
jgi:hypothetical protein